MLHRWVTRRGRCMPVEYVAGILLAAGGATRFGADKLAAEWRGRTLLQHSAQAMLDAGLRPVLAVVRPDVAPALPDLVGPVVNHRWRDGIATSVQAGLAALDAEPGVCAAVVAPADQPWCGEQVYRRLLNAFLGSRPEVVVASYHGTMRNPVLLARSRWPLAGQAKGETGLSAVVRALSPLTVECGDVGSVRDIDTSADLEYALRSEDAWPVIQPDPTQRVM